ncbi:hypothetical protein CC80DRAFT_491444 [Byssothecium circinans]|uniref:Uncharacterized protein n=1 Tax=Byssothecium circinans TaxID=147558 RepID=A0A6A5U010_9PLEO|nr:hypothetical protein CC80DRAFT_491444 [Byssothecium circinans]
MIEHSREQQREFLGVFRELFGREQEAGGSAAPSVEVERRIGALEERLKEQKQEQDKKLEMIIGLLQQRVGSESSSKEGGGGKESSSGRESIV